MLLDADGNIVYGRAGLLEHAASSPLRSLIRTDGASNRGRHSNDEIDAVIDVLPHAIRLLNSDPTDH